MNKNRLKDLYKESLLGGYNKTIEEFEKELIDTFDAIRKGLREKGYEVPNTDEGMEMFLMMLHK